MSWRSLTFAAMILAFNAVPALAQGARGYRIDGPEGVELRIGPLGPSPTRDSVAQMLSEALAHFDNSAINVRTGVVRVGEEFATEALPYERVGRLGNNVVRRSPLGEEILLLPAGTPLFSHDFLYEDVLALNGRARSRTLWCGVTGDAGYCLLERNGVWESARILSRNLYAPTELAAFTPVNEAVLLVDESVRALFPQRTETYRLVGMRGATAQVTRGLRIGEIAFDIATADERRFRLGSILIEFEPGPEGSALVKADAMDPANYRSELRSLARILLARAYN